MRHEIRWTFQKIRSRLAEIEPLVYRQQEPLPAFRFRYLTDPTDPPPVDPGLDDSSWQVVSANSYWGSPRTDFILRTLFQVPQGWAERGPVALYLPLGDAHNFSHPEALAYIDGRPYATCDRHHQEFLLPEAYNQGTAHSLTLHGWTGIGGMSIADMSQKLFMHTPAIVLIDPPTREFCALTRVALGIVEHIEERDPTRHKLLTALDAAFQALDLRTPLGLELGEAFYASVPAALETLQSGIAQSGPPLDVEISAIGHAHIDVAWLWTLGQTRQKSARTFHTVLRLMEQFPEYIFAQSQPQLYDYIRQDFPELFTAIQQRVAEGRWEPIGGMWVEADCNLSGPESLARQFLLGRSFFKEHFGQDTESPVLWLPDVFGYAWNLPQLIKEAGLEYFFTIKIGWSQYNRLPYDSFWWQGLDGTRVLTHFSTTKEPEGAYVSTYNADASPGQTLGTWFNFQQKDYAPPGETPQLLMSYGYGDGGGGPTHEMLENIHLMKNFPATPQIRPGKVGDFFRRLQAQAADLPVWNGELYLEYHRGTYTTQARNKRANRQSEFLLHDAEFICTYAALLDPGYVYPAEQLRKGWELVCLNQFHDIIPGSSIAEVYSESLAQYAEVRRLAESAQDEALAVLSAILGNQPLLVNPTSFPRQEPVLLDGSWHHPAELQPYAIQTFNPQPATLEPANPLICTPTLLENELLQVEFNAAGDISRIYDKRAGREVLPQDALANQFQAFEDRPLSWDAWDIDIFYEDKQWLAEPATTVRVIESGPYKATVEIERQILNSRYTQRISLTAGSPRLDFDTHIEWNERRVLLKVAFPVEVFSPKATYEIQWGNVERPTHRNTSWDWARFETAAQKWVDLSEGDYGVSLLNDCKYGHDIHANVLRLTLLRGTTSPDPLADAGEHQFRYSLLPHTGSWDAATVAAAYALNDPLIVYQPPSEPTSNETRQLPPLVQVDRPNIAIETIKQAEDGRGMILRLYEFQRQRGAFQLNCAFEIAQAWQSNLLEQDQVELPVTGRQLIAQIHPYQVLTLRLLPK